MSRCVQGFERYCKYPPSFIELTVVLMADAVRENGDEANLFVLLLEAEVDISPVGQSQKDRKRSWNGHHGRSSLLF